MTDCPALGDGVRRKEEGVLSTQSNSLRHTSQTTTGTLVFLFVALCGSLLVGLKTRDVWTILTCQAWRLVHCLTLNAQFQAFSLPRSDGELCRNLTAQIQAWFRNSTLPRFSVIGG